MKKNLKFGLKILLIFISIPFCRYLFNSIQVSKSLNDNDLNIIKMLDVDKTCQNLNDYNSEINCIRSIQLSQKVLIESDKCRLGKIDVEPINFLNAKTGCCFDRARLIEKALTFYGFETRRVSLIPSDKNGFFSLIIPNKDTHAASEAKTSKGWIGVETIGELFILKDEFNNPLTFRKALKTNYNFPERPSYKSYRNNFYYRNPIVIVGLYSRHGKFHKPYLPLPEINISEFLYNFELTK